MTHVFIGIFQKMYNFTHFLKQNIYFFKICVFSFINIKFIFDFLKFYIVYLGGKYVCPTSIPVFCWLPYSNIVYLGGKDVCPTCIPVRILLVTLSTLLPHLTLCTYHCQTAVHKVGHFFLIKTKHFCVLKLENI